MKKIAILLMLFSNGISMSAQIQIAGKVSSLNGNPLIGCTILLPELNKGTVSDINGEYHIENIPIGKTKIQFSYIGYNSIIKILTLQNPLNQLDIVLVESIIESQEVVITGGLLSSQHENAVKIDVLKNKDILLSGTPNLMESLTKIPGVDMIAKGQGVSKPVIRGLSMNDILVMSNGVRIENYQFSENHPLGVDDNDVNRVEIIKGPASLLYGSDAIGGVLNFIKGKPAPTGKIIGDYQMQLHSNTLGLNNSLGIKGASQHFFGGFRVSNKTHADYKQGGGTFVPNSRFNEWSVSTNTGYTGKIGTFKLSYDYFKQKLGMTVPAVQSYITKQGRDNDIWYQDLNHQLISSQNKLYLGNFKWETNIAYQLAMRKLQTTLDVPVVEMNLNTFTYESKLYLPSAEGSDYIVGFQGKSQTNRNHNNRMAQFLPDANVTNLGVFALIQYTFFEKLKLQGGLRFDRYKTETYAMGSAGTESYHAPVSLNFSSPNASLGVTYNLNEKLIFRANMAKSYRAPNLSELTSNGLHGSRYEVGNDALIAEDAYETDISMHYHGEYLSLDLAGFYNQINNYIFNSPTSEVTSADVAIYRFLQTNARLYGWEAGVHFHPKSLPWLHAQATYSSVTGVQENGNYLPFIPAHKFHYELRAEGQKIGFLRRPNFKISALMALKQSKKSPYETDTNGYTLVNLGANAEIKLLNQFANIGLSVNNLFDTQYYDHLSTLKPLIYFNQGRNISLSLKVPFEIK